MPSDVPGRNLVGTSAAMLQVWKLIGRAAASTAPVLITGETGTHARVWERDDLADHVLLTAGGAYQVDRAERRGPEQRPPAIARRARRAPIQLALEAGGVVETHIAPRANPSGAHDPALLIAAEALYLSFNPARLPARGGPTTEGSLRVGIELR